MPSTMDVQDKHTVPRPSAYTPGLNLAEIHVPYVHYSDDPRDPDLQLPEDLLVFMYRMACKAATNCRRQYEATLHSRKDKTSSSLTTAPSLSPASPRSSVSSYFPTPPPPAEDAHFVLSSSSPLNTLLLPTHDPTHSLPRYAISRAIDYPTRGWLTATLQSGPMIGRVENKPGSSKGAVLYGGRQCPLKKCLVQDDPNSLQFYAPELHPARFIWSRDPLSGDFKCLVHRPSEQLPTVAASLSVPAREADHPTLVVRPDAMDCLDMILLTMLVVENGGR